MGRCCCEAATGYDDFTNAISIHSFANHSYVFNSHTQFVIPTRVWCWGTTPSASCWWPYGERPSFVPPVQTHFSERNGFKSATQTIPRCTAALSVCSRTEKKMFFIAPTLAQNASTIIVTLTAGSNAQQTLGPLPEREPPPGHFVATHYQAVAP